jgi:Uma2 family endonuclease
MRSMSASAVAKKTWTTDEYLAWERASPQKHELFEGEVFAMAGASEEHNLIVANILRELGNLFRKRPCKVYPSDMRVKAPTGLYTYPDVSAICGRPDFEDAELDTLLNPTVLFEVLSDSTELYDRGKKFASYRTIPSLKDYVLVSQDSVFVEHFTRQADGTWNLREVRSGQRLELASVEGVIEVDEIYLKVFGDAAGE